MFDVPLLHYSASPLTLVSSMPPSPPPTANDALGSFVAAEPAGGVGCGNGPSGKAPHAQQHLRRLSETRAPGAEVSGGRQAVPPQLLQVCMCVHVCAFDSL